MVHTPVCASAPVCVCVRVCMSCSSVVPSLEQEQARRRVVARGRASTGEAHVSCRPGLCFCREAEVTCARLTCTDEDQVAGTHG